jgi:uncharacterized protein
MERMIPGPRLVAVSVMVSLGVLSGCSAADGTADGMRSPAASATAPTSGSPASSSSPQSLASGAPSVTPSTAPSEAPVPEAASRVSIPALMTKRYDGGGLRLGRVLLRTSDYTRRTVSYRSGDLRISGILNLPHGRGPFPVLVLLHGHIDTSIYVTGQGLMREQDYLARRGYAVLHTDYRNHASSDDDPSAERGLRLGYTEDTVNAVLAVRESGIARLDGERVGLLGRSMGGGVTYNTLVAQPGLVQAAVVFAPVSSRTKDNFNRWIRGDRSELAAEIVARHGSPEGNPRFWREVSPRTYFDRVTEPLLIHHGTSDDSCPIRWTRATYDALRDNGKAAKLFVYDGEEHAFGPQWPLSMQRTVRFLDRHLGV